MSDPGSRRAKARVRRKEEAKGSWKKYLLIFLAVLVIFLMLFSSFMPFLGGY